MLRKRFLKPSMPCELFCIFSFGVLLLVSGWRCPDHTGGVCIIKGQQRELSGVTVSRCWIILIKEW